MAWPWLGHGLAMAWPWLGHGLAMACPWLGHGLAMAPYIYIYIYKHCEGVLYTREGVSKRGSPDTVWNNLLRGWCCVWGA